MTPTTGPMVADLDGLEKLAKAATPGPCLSAACRQCGRPLWMTVQFCDRACQMMFRGASNVR